VWPKRRTNCRVLHEEEDSKRTVAKEKMDKLKREEDERRAASKEKLTEQKKKAK